MSKKSLYERLGGYDAISAVSNDLVDRLQKDPQLGRFWQHRGEDGIEAGTAAPRGFSLRLHRRPDVLQGP